MLLVASTTFFYFALRYLPLAEAAAISFVGPVLTALLSGPMLGDKVTRRQWFAVTLGFVGVLIIMRPGGGVLSLAAVFPLATAILFSVYQIVTRKLVGTRTSLYHAFLYRHRRRCDHQYCGAAALGHADLESGRHSSFASACSAASATCC